MPVQWDPAAPPGTSPLKLGPSNFRSIEQNLLKLFSLPTVGINPFGAPFHFDSASDQTAGLLSIVGNPVADLGIVPKQYADARTPFIALDAGGGPNVYTATVPASFVRTTNAVYIVLNNGNATDGLGVSLVLNAIATTVRRLDGSAPLSPGEFVAGGMYAMMFDGTSFRIIGFVGGSITQDTVVVAPATVTLAQDPVAALEAVTKQYVDAQHHIYGLTRKPLGGDLAPAVGDQVVLSQTLTTPNDGRTYRVYTSYNMLITFAGNNLLQTYCVDSPQTGLWAQSNGIAAPISGAAGSGYSSVTFAANTAVTVELHGTIPTLIWTAKANWSGVGVGTYLDMGFVLA